MKIKEKSKNAESTVDADNKRIMIAFRIDTETQNKLRIIANRKKATQTKVISELINIAYAGLYTPVSKELNKMYSLILNKEAIKSKKRKSK